jgi:hypothetical protein
MDTFIQPVPITFMALLLAHLTGDFLLQPGWIVKNKGKQTWPLICHGIIHLLLAWACLLIFAQIRLLSIVNQLIILGYVLAHLLIDKLKYRLTARKALPDDWKTFLLDQLLHLIVLACAAILLTGGNVGQMLKSIHLSASTKTHILEVAIVYVAVIFAGGYLIRYINKGLAGGPAAVSPGSLENAGLYIGWIERFLIVTAIVMLSPALVGLILAGKSIARFTEFKQVRFVEYFLIGTFLSISLSVVGGIVLLQLLYGTVWLR